MNSPNNSLIEKNRVHLKGDGIVNIDVVLYHVEPNLFNMCMYEKISPVH